MSTITKGYTFGATELVTNTKLHTLVDSATIDLANDTINSLTATGISAASGNVDGTWRCDIFRLDQAPLTATASAQKVPFTCDSFFNLSLNGTTYYIPCASATS